MKSMNDSDRGRGKKKRGEVRRRGGRETERESGGEQGLHPTAWADTTVN